MGDFQIADKNLIWSNIIPETGNVDCILIGVCVNDHIVRTTISMLKHNSENLITSKNVVYFVHHQKEIHFHLTYVSTKL